MSKLIRLALVAMVLTGATEAMARNSHDPFWTDMSKPYGGYAPDSQEGTQSFWDYLSREGS